MTTETKTITTCDFCNCDNNIYSTTKFIKIKNFDLCSHCYKVFKQLIKELKLIKEKEIVPTHI